MKYTYYSFLSFVAGLLPVSSEVNGLRKSPNRNLSQIHYDEHSMSGKSGKDQGDEGDNSELLKITPDVGWYDVFLT